MGTTTAKQLPRANELTQALNRCNTENPSPEDVAAMRKHLQDVPGLWRLCGDLASTMTQAVIAGINTTPAIRESVIMGRETMRRELGYDTSPMLEQMLIDHLLLCWVRLQLAEHAYTGCLKEGGTLNQGEFWEKRLSAVQRRYLRAVESLARIRRMNLPTIQINVADKQVNVA